jgi:hypothetical protein
MTQDCPELPFPDQDQAVIQGRYNERDPQTTWDEWAQVREEYLAYPGTIPDEAWEREGRHPSTPFSLNDQLFLICWHDLIHLHILTEKLA